MLIADFVHAAWLALAIVLKITVNIFLKYSDVFKKPLYGLLSLCCVLLAFSALAQAVKSIVLSLAYAVWGGFGIIATMRPDGCCLTSGLTAKGWGFDSAAGRYHPVKAGLIELLNQ